MRDDSDFEAQLAQRLKDFSQAPFPSKAADVARVAMETQDGWLARSRYGVLIVAALATTLATFVVFSSGLLSGILPQGFSSPSIPESSIPTELPSSIVDDASPAKWRLDPTRPIRADSTSFVALVHEVACSGNRPIDEILLPPVISYGKYSIRVTLYLEPLPPGDYPCIGNAETEFKIALREPIGNRLLIDTGVPTN